MNILSTHNLTKTYGTGDNVVHALTDVSLDIEEGKFVSIIGSSGSGKSTQHLCSRLYLHWDFP